jgi:hypothetical protein
MKKDDRKMVAWGLAFEGCITLGIGKHIEKDGKINVSYQPQIAITNTDKELLEKFLSVVKIGTIYERSVRNERYKLQYRWVVHKLDLIKDFLKEIVPYLPAKKKRGELMLEFCESRLKWKTRGYTEREKQICNEIMRL